MDTTTETAEQPLSDLEIFSIDDSQFTDRDTLLRALDAEGVLYVGQVIYACRKHPIPGQGHFHAIGILADANIKINPSGPDPSDPFGPDPLSVNYAAFKELQDLLDGWAIKHLNNGQRALLGESREIVLTEPMLRDFYSRIGLNKVPNHCQPMDSDSISIH